MSGDSTDMTHHHNTESESEPSGGQSHAAVKSVGIMARKGRNHIEVTQLASKFAHAPEVVLKGPQTAGAHLG